MNVSRLTLTMTLLGALSAGAAVISAAGVLEDEVTLRGCLVKGDGGGDGYLLSNAPGEPAWQRSSDARIEPGTVGTSGGFESIFYWLDDHDDLSEHVGRRVEIKGDLEGDLEDGEITLDRKDNWTELTIKSDGRSMKANVPNASFAPAPRDRGDRKVRVLVRKVDVEDVRMLSAVCDAP